MKIYGQPRELEEALNNFNESAALQHKKSNGAVYSALPLGYEAQDGKLVPINEELLIISEIKYMRDDGLSLHKIAADLNGRGIIGKRGGKFYASAIKAICDNDLHKTGYSRAPLRRC